MFVCTSSFMEAVLCASVACRAFQLRETKNKIFKYLCFIYFFFLPVFTMSHLFKNSCKSSEVFGLNLFVFLFLSVTLMLGLNSKPGFNRALQKQNQIKSKSKSCEHNVNRNVKRVFRPRPMIQLSSGLVLYCRQQQKMVYVGVYIHTYRKTNI